MSDGPLFLGGRAGNADDSIDPSLAGLNDVDMSTAAADLDPALSLNGNVDTQSSSSTVRESGAEAALPHPSSDDAASMSDVPPSQPHAGAPSSQDDLPPDSDLVASLPVYLSKSLLSSSSLHLFQYPTFPRDRPLPVPFSAASRGLKVSGRWRPKANRVEVDLPLDVREDVYNMDRGADFGAGADIIAQRQAKIDAAYAGAAASSSSGSGKVKKEKMEEERAQRERGPKRLDKTRLDSIEVPKATNYLVGVIRDQALHLTPLKSVVQLRPSMHYLDALDEAREAEKRRDRAAAAGEATDSEDEDELIEMEQGASKKKSSASKDKKPAGAATTAQTLSVAMRGDPNAAKGGAGGDKGDLMAAQREADAERWVDLEWKDEESEESEQAFKTQLFAGSKKRLDCITRPREYLLEVEQR